MIWLYRPDDVTRVYSSLLRIRSGVAGPTAAVLATGEVATVAVVVVGVAVAVVIVVVVEEVDIGSGK